MALLDIRIAKKVTITCTLEELTAAQVNEYAAFIKVPADEVVNKALEYVFTKDREFQQFRENNPSLQVHGSLRIKKPLAPPTGAKRGRKPALVAAS